MKNNKKESHEGYPHDSIPELALAGWSGLVLTGLNLAAYFNPVLFSLGRELQVESGALVITEP